MLQILYHARHPFFMCWEAIVAVQLMPFAKCAYSASRCFAAFFAHIRAFPQPFICLSASCEHAQPDKFGLAERLCKNKIINNQALQNCVLYDTINKSIFLYSIRVILYSILFIQEIYALFPLTKAGFLKQV